MALNSSKRFNEKLRSRIFTSSIDYISNSSSGSEHDDALSDVVSPSPSPCLSFLVQNFLEDDFVTNDSTESTRDVSTDFDSDLTDLIESVVYPSVNDNVDSFRNQVFVSVVRAVEIFAIFRKNKSSFNRNLMTYLREIGYNAGVCKIRWDANGGLTAGSYEFIDVISPSSRYLIDTEFSGEFELARETERYSKVRRSLPKVFVGEGDDLKRITRLMCDEARRSMKANGLTLPPWRKNRYMQMKWLGPYWRTLNQFPLSSISPVSSNVKCRCVGFELSGDVGRVFVSPATTT